MNEWILSSSVLILIVIALRAVFKGRISLRLQYAIWGLVLLRLLIPFSFGSSSISVANLTNRVERPVVEQQPETPDVTIPADHNVHSTAPQPEQKPSQENVSEKPGTAEKPFNWAGAVEIFWAVGAVCVAGLFLGTNLRFKTAVTRSRQSLEIRKNKLAVYVTDRIDTPCLFGFLDPGIYVTNPVARDKTLLRHTLEHEATHYRHGDHIWAVLRCVCLVVHWYNPLVWWAAFLSQRDGELACDEATIRRLGEGERGEYGRTLISMTCRKRANVLVTATMMTTGKTGIKERIHLIARKPKMAIYALICVLMVAAVAVGCTFTGGKEDTTGELSGTNVFPSGSEVTGITVHGQPDSQVSVDAAYLSEMEAWAKSFVYGDTVDANKEFDPGSNACSITLHYDDGAEVTCYLDYQIVNGATYRIIRDALPQCWEDVWRSEEQSPTEPTQGDYPDNAPPVSMVEHFYKDPDKNKVCIAAQPTELTVDGGDFLYIIPQEQGLLLKYYTEATTAAHPYTYYDNSDPSAGWWIVYQEKWWLVTESGAMFSKAPDLLCVDQEAARQLYEICDAAAKEAGVGDPVRPGGVTNIISATLEWNGVHTINDEYALSRIEKWITESREIGSAACWFGALLTLEMENGESKTIAMATDNCAAWMSEGVTYSFGEITEEGVMKNDEFYALFAPAVIYEKSKEGMDVLKDYMHYLNWSRYANQYGEEETFTLIDMIMRWAEEDPTHDRFGRVMDWTVGLDGAYADYHTALLSQLYTLNRGEFAWACLGNATDAVEERTILALAYHWQITPEEAREKLEATAP